MQRVLELSHELFVARRIRPYDMAYIADLQKEIFRLKAVLRES